MRETYEVGPGKTVTVTVQVDDSANSKGEPEGVRALLADAAGELGALTNAYETVETKRQWLALDNEDLRARLADVTAELRTTRLALADMTKGRDATQEKVLRWSRLARKADFDKEQIRDLNLSIAAAQVALTSPAIVRTSSMDQSPNGRMLSGAIETALRALDSGDGHFE